MTPKVLTGIQRRIAGACLPNKQAFKFSVGRGPQGPLAMRLLAVRG